MQNTIRKRGLNNYPTNYDDSSVSQDLAIMNENSGKYGEYGVDGEYYPVGIRATTTIQLSKDLFIDHNDLHFKLQKYLLRAFVELLNLDGSQNIVYPMIISDM